MNAKPARVLVIAGSDSGGGAGIQADIKTITALGGYAMTALTAVTVQDTTGVHGIHAVPLSVIREQIRACLSDIGADAIKTGMLGTAEIVVAVAEEMAALAKHVPLIVDPVMVAKGGARLLAADAIEALRSRLLPLAAVVTPNAPEAEALTGVRIATPDDQERAGRVLCDMGAGAALVKGGHLASDTLTDVLVEGARIRRFVSPRIETASTHGTGCTLASALAAGIAQGLSVEAATARARAYVRAAILAAPGFGRGHGPLNHMHAIGPYGS